MATRIITKAIWQTRLLPYWFTLLDFCLLWDTLNRRADLEGLVAWAGRKTRLKGLRTYYKRLLFETEALLAVRTMRYRTLSFWTVLLYSTYRFIFPPNHLHKTGSAAKYRLCQRSLI